ncbi:MAG: hypothetical protein ACFFCO_07355 [Promethearchaeota archaeon]
MEPARDKSLFFKIRSALAQLDESPELGLGVSEAELRGAFPRLREAAEEYHQERLLIDAVAHYAVLVRVAEVLGEPEWRARMLHGYGIVNLDLKDYKECVAALRGALEVAQEEGLQEVAEAVMVDLEAARRHWSRYRESLEP